MEGRGESRDGGNWKGGGVKSGRMEEREKGAEERKGGRRVEGERGKRGGGEGFGALSPTCGRSILGHLVSKRRWIPSCSLELLLLSMLL